MQPHNRAKKWLGEPELATRGGETLPKDLTAIRDILPYEEASLTTTGLTFV